MNTENIFEKRQNVILESLENDFHWESKYRRIIEWGQKMKTLAPSLHEEKWLVRGCQSQVWLYPQMKDNHLIFQGDSDALITKGLLALLLYFYSDAPSQDILQNPPAFIQKLDLINHLTPSRSNGLSALTSQIQNYAKAFSAIKQK